MGYENHQITIDGMTNRICIIGHFGFGYNLLNGQTIKTHIIANELEKQMKDIVLSKIDTHNFKNKLLLLPRSFYALIKNDNIIILPAHNALLIEVPWLILWNYIFNRNLHYVVIGGWLVSFLNKHIIVKRLLRSFDGIYVETSSMKRALEKDGFNNVNILRNCKSLLPLKDSDLNYSYTEPYRLVTFSRVMRQKGIEDVVHAVLSINQEVGRNILSLDIYGQVEEGEKDWFEKMMFEIPSDSPINYCGTVAFNASTKVLSQYFALLFPTHFYTEGIPGTIIDAYAAGLPVIAARWENFDDVIVDGITGFGYEFDDANEMRCLLYYFALNPEKIYSKRLNCLKKAQDFLPENAFSSFVGIIKSCGMK